MTKKQAIEFLKEYTETNFSERCRDAHNMAIKALEQQKPLEKFENAKDHIRKLAGDYKCYDNRLTDEEALELCHILEQQPCDDCVSRQAVLSKAELIELEDGQSFMSIDPEDVKALPPVTPTFPKGATNGDVIKAMFPNIEADEIKTNTGGYIEVKYLDTTDKRDATAFRKSWWNAPYKRGDLDGSN